MQHRPKLSEIRAFIALAETGSFAAAGKLLDRDPTVLSRSVQSIERRLGVRLAERSTRAVTLTEAGGVFLSRVTTVLRDLEAAEREAASFAQGEPQGHLRVALPGSFARLWMAPLITEFLHNHPQITLEASYSNLMIDFVARGFDLAVRLAELPASGLVARRVADRRRLLCAAPSYLARHPPLTHPRDLPAHPGLCFTGREDPFRWTFQRRPGAPQSVLVSPRVASDDADILVEAAVAGLGVFYTTDWHVGPLLADGRLVEILPDWPVADGGGIYVMTASITGLPRKTRAFSNWVAIKLAERPWNVGRQGG